VIDVSEKEENAIDLTFINSESVPNEIDGSELQSGKHNEQRISR
jgi:hypothetical protein